MGDTGRSYSNWNMSQMVEDSQNGERVGRKPKTDRTRRSWSIQEEEGDHKIDCDNDQWEQIVKVDNNARYMRFKSWPMFDEWKDIFGKDRATGSAGQDLLELYHDVSPNINVGNESQESQFEASDDARSGINPDNNMGSPEMPDQNTGNIDTGTQLPKKTNGDTGTQFSKKTAQQLDAAEFILSKVEHLDLFMCLPEAFHHDYVLRAPEKNR
ncbi:hypothetical protein AAHA92_05494 [Salvia divinorum]|uniref:Uncharacterized protein n=1 Tax=Salvia divinorum TaxID=28513 RepID=A0ABD1I3L3_SALDI